MSRFAQLRSQAAVALTLFVLALGSMGLAPWVHPVAFERVCSASGSRFVDPSGSTVDPSSHPDHGDPGGHCPLCMPVGAPPSTIVLAVAPVRPPGFVRQRSAEARLASLVGAPLPARGPPRLA